MSIPLRALVATLAAATALQARAEEPTDSTENPNLVSWEAQADLVSQYRWRGLLLGLPSVQPYIGVSWRGLSLGAWANIGLTDEEDEEEIDFTLDYSHGLWHAGITDYWYAGENSFRGSFADIHQLEANVGIDLGFASVDWYTVFAGYDERTEHDHRAYSSYLEAAAPFALWGCDWTATIGIVPWATDYYETSGFAVTDIQLRAEHEFTLGRHLALPLYAAVGINPCASEPYAFVGVALKKL